MSEKLKVLGHDENGKPLQGNIINPDCYPTPRSWSRIFDKPSWFSNVRFINGIHPNDFKEFCDEIAITFEPKPPILFMDELREHDPEEWVEGVPGIGKTKTL